MNYKHCTDDIPSDMSWEDFHALSRDEQFELVAAKRFLDLHRWLKMRRYVLEKLGKPAAWWDASVKEAAVESVNNGTLTVKELSDVVSQPWRLSQKQLDLHAADILLSFLAGMSAEDNLVAALLGQPTFAQGT